MADFPTLVPHPWRCTACHCLMYNLDLVSDTEHPGEMVLVPVDEAPQPQFVNADYPKTCKVCFELYYAIFDRPYWKQLQANWVVEQEKKRKMLRGDEDPPPRGYFPF